LLSIFAAGIQQSKGEVFLPHLKAKLTASVIICETAKLGML
jgi:hypothetical protein